MTDTRYQHPELQLALTCVAVAMEFTPPRQLTGPIETPINWARFLEVIAWHRLDSFVHKAFSEHHPQWVPDEVINNLRDRRMRDARLSLLQAGALVKITDLFEAHDIPFFYFKGQALARDLYGDSAMRKSRDLDLMVAPEHVHKACQLLCDETGLRPVEELTPLQQDKLLSGHNELELEGGGICVELHWRFAYIRDVCPIDEQPLLANPAKTQIGGKNIPTVTLTQLIPYLSYHGNAHVWKRIFWICDLAAMTRRDLDWSAILQQAADLKQSRTLMLGMCLARDLLGATLPDIIEHAVADDVQAVERMLHHNLTFLFRPSPDPYQCEDSLKERLSWTLRAQNEQAFKWRVLWLYLFQPRLSDYGAVALPRPLHGLYHLIRPCRLIWRGLTGP